MADPADPSSLLALQTQLRDVAGAVAGEQHEPRNAPSELRRATEEAERLVGRIISDDLTDAGAALRSVGDAVDRLQRWVEQAASTAGAEPAAVTPPPDESSTGFGAFRCEPSATDVACEDPIGPDDLPLIRDFAAEAREHLESAEAAILAMEQNPGDLEPVKTVFRGFHTIKGVAGFLNLKQVGDLAHAAESLLDLVRHSESPVPAEVIGLVLEATDEMKRLLIALDEASRLGRGMARQPRLADLLGRLSACTLEPAGEKPSPTSNVTAREQSPRKPEPQGTEATCSARHVGTASVRVATDRLDALVDVVGELVIAHAMVVQGLTPTVKANHRLARNLSHLGKLARELQGLSMSLRMVPIHGVFRKMARLARDLAHEAGKEVSFITEGGETELDRTLIEAVGDPLMHMVRNAIDHGIEAADVRERAGKPRAGRVALRAHHRAGSVIIEVTDDGRGLDAERIRSKALAAGVVAEDRELSEQDVFRLIFHPGLSTAEKVTEVSGRGVGMDVVRRNAEALRGRVDIASARGRGATFTLRLPLTLAAIDGLVVGVGGERYVIPITSIERSIRLRAEQLSTVHGRGEVCLVRGSALPLFRLYKLLGVAGATQDPVHALAVIVEDDGRRCALLVDEAVGQQQVLIKPLGDGIGTVPGVAGGAILGDGNVSLILDVPGLIDLASVNANGTGSGRNEGVEP